MDKYDCLKLENQLCFPIYLCSKEVTKRYTPFLNKLNLTYTQYIVMLYLWEKGVTNIKHLGDVLLLESNTLTPLIKKLEAKGYVVKTRSKEDERNIYIDLTQKGLELKEKALEIPKLMGNCISLNQDEAKDLYSLVYKVIMNIKGDKNDNRS